MKLSPSSFNSKRYQTAKRLKVDKSFTPCITEDNDELYPNGVFVFNITKMIQHIESNKNEFELLEIETIDFHIYNSSINESHLDSVDVSKPAIIAEISPGRYNLIDGHHRLEKARRMKIRSIPAYKLNVDQHIQFLTEIEAYIAYIEYWNSKISAD
ncbi:ParB/RepB/Spo0J family partition protein [bacterium]|nr:ParB/RepB/Spo0J family partition protein [bacterium]